jgi:hypothetical protein
MRKKLFVAGVFLALCALALVGLVLRLAQRVG